MAWVTTKVFKPRTFKKGTYVVDFWKRGEVKVDRNLKRVQVKARTKAEAIRKARTKL